jgi:RHS repeat-associated protein
VRFLPFRGLRPTGNRLSVAELSGRTVTYGYDDLYRLTSETVASDPGGNNGQVSYTLDSVGNRLQRSSTLPAIVPTGLLSYDANDRVSTDSYDANGNTTLNSGQTNVYDFENRLVQRGGVKIVYDGDGNRVKETVATVTTSYLVADQNPTGYAQVLDELQGGAVTRTYSYGLELINQRQTLAGTLTTSFYGFDGHGSIRFLTSSTGAITDTYDYDAFGNLIASTGSTPNNYLFAGEQFDPALGIYYNRARYYDQRQGRFWTMDTFEGDPESPASLHKYLYAGANPADRTDPSGNDFSVGDLAIASAIGATIGGISTIAANYALGRTQTALSIAQGVAVGAVLGPVALVFPTIGAGIGVLGIGGAGFTVWKAFNNPNSSVLQKTAAMALLVAAFYGATRAFQYAANPQTPVPPVINEAVPPLLKVPGTLDLEPGAAEVSPQDLLLGRQVLLQGKIDSIQTSGPSQTEPIIVSRNGVVWDGNHRVFLAAQSGVPSIRVIVMDIVIDGGYPISKVPIAGAK